MVQDMNNFQFSQPFKVLVVEHEPLIRFDLEDILLERGAQTVLGTGDLKSAKALLATHNDIDLIILDLDLPDESGIEFAKKLCEEKIPLLISSLYNNSDVANIPVVSKPYYEESLMRVLQTIIMLNAEAIYLK